MSSVDLLNLQHYAPWIQRKAEVLRTIEAQDADLLSIQECSPGQLRELRARFKDTYTVVANVNFTPDVIVAFKKERFILLERGHWGLADPYLPLLRRIAIWVKLEEKASGRQFLFVGTHLDGRPIKTKQAERLKSNLQEERASGAPLFLTGDFNIAPDEDGYPILLSDGWKDSFPFDPLDQPTFPRHHLQRRIDHVLYFGAQIHIQGWHTVGQQASRISDHLPVLVQVQIDETS
jgi:endonuclease/exonuclease/phosphatase family metal-dependent hydrolase